MFRGRGKRCHTCAISIPHFGGAAPTGKVLIVAGSENDASNQSAGEELNRNAIWDPTGTTKAAATTYNLNYALLFRDCRTARRALTHYRWNIQLCVLLATTAPRSSTRRTRRSSAARVMVDGRWYATATALGDGRIATLSGLKSGGGTTTRSRDLVSCQERSAGWTSSGREPFNPPLLHPIVPAAEWKGVLHWAGHGPRNRERLDDETPRHGGSFDRVLRLRRTGVRLLRLAAAAPPGLHAEVT